MTQFRHGQLHGWPVQSMGSGPFLDRRRVHRKAPAHPSEDPPGATRRAVALRAGLSTILPSRTLRAMWTYLISGAAVLIAGVAAYYSKRSSDAAEAVDRRERTPELTIFLDHPAEAPVDLAIYRIRNDGPQDLDSVTIYRPRPPDRITYPIVATGAGGAGWADDEVALGPLALTAEDRITLCCSAAPTVPDFLVRIECARGKDRWTLTRQLPNPRPARDPLGPDPAGARDAIERAREAFQEMVTHGGRDSRFFLQDWRRVEQALEDNTGRVGEALQARMEQIIATWRQTFALAPPGQYVINLDTPPDLQRQRRLADQADAGQRGLEECAIALRLLNELESELPAVERRTA